MYLLLIYIIIIFLFLINDKKIEGQSDSSILLNFKYDYNVIDSPNASDTIQLTVNTNDTINDIKSKLSIKEKSIPQNLMKLVATNILSPGLVVILF